ncbi:EAL domain-containing protein [Methylorubrum sp. SB2]|uniref:sensor domain-containing protein n=1 Tax=Methylorubrum subtropicum TaxID=3138812 RepID=UPI00313EA3FF
MPNRAHDSDAMYRLLVQGVTDYAIYMLSPDGTVANWNAGAQRAKGYSAEEIVGRHFSCFYTPEDRAAGLPERGLATARWDGGFETQGWRLRKDGSRFWAHVVIDPIYDDGHLVGYAKVTRDWTDLQLMMDASREHERRFRLLVQGVTDYAIYMLAPDGTVANWNAGAQRAKGYTAEEIVGRHFACFYTPEDRAAGLPERGLATARADGRFEAEGWRLRKDGTRFWAHVVIDAIKDDEGAFAGYAKITRDCTEQRLTALNLDAARQKLDLALANMSQGLCLIDGEGRLVLANARLAEMLGTAADVSPVGLSVHAVLANAFGPAADAFVHEHLRPDLPSDRPVVSEIAGPERILSATTRPLAGGGWVSTFTDTSERRRYEDRIRYLARHDALTGLANRTTLHEHLAAVLRFSGPGGARADDERRAVLFLDLDRFKPINDTLGHAVGDRLLQEVARRLRGAVRAYDFVARLGGDEFAVVLDAVEAVHLPTIADRIIEALNRPFTFDGLSLTVGVSIGIAVSCETVHTPDELLRDADLALYRAKKDGRNRHRFYDPSMSEVVNARAALETELRRAFREGALSLHYQPIVRARSGTTIGFETLLRWHRADGSAISPAIFVPVAEEAGMMPEIGAWVLMEACREAAGWPAGLSVAINVSATQLRDPRFTETVERALASSGLPAARLEIEITETAVLENRELALALLQRVAALGVRIALDDFGTGYSSLSFVHSFPLSRIKIDRSFVKGLGQDPQSTAIVRAILGLSRSLGLAVTAEGVETEAQRLILVKERCPDLQGFLFGRPEARPRLPEPATRREPPQPHAA